MIDYKINNDDTLTSIAEKYNITVDELIEFHNSKVGITKKLFGNEIPLHISEIKIQQDRKFAENTSEFDKIKFRNKIRYRCEQFNTTKLEENITFHCNTKKEYTLEQSENGNNVKIKLEEFLYKINPTHLSAAIEATKELEYDKENVILLLDNNGIERVLNFKEIKQKWINFKPKLKKSEFYLQIEKVNSKAAQDIINGGDIEFESEDNLKKTYDKNLLYHVLFKKIDDKRKEHEILNFNSKIFVEIPLSIELQHSIVKEDDYFIEYRTVGTLLKEELNYERIIKQYNQFYKPIIEYGFSDYNYVYRIRRRINRKTGLIESASVMIKEEVVNNYQLITQFDLKQIDNY